MQIVYYIQHSLLLLQCLVAYAVLIIIYQACIFGVQLLTISAPAGVSIYNATPVFVHTSAPEL